jgi:orotidine-5'-phosphate decarboxylase
VKTEKEKGIEPMERKFMDLLHGQWDAGKFSCVGLDTNHREISDEIKASLANAVGSTSVAIVRRFNRKIIEATADLAGMYKPNIAFYEALGSQGLDVLRSTVAYIHQVAPQVPVILDAKRADIGSTNKGYVDMIDWLGADAITAHPYLGSEALGPFLERKDKGVIVLCRTSNPGAKELQNYFVIVKTGDEHRFFFENNLANHLAIDYRDTPNNATSHQIAVPLYQHLAYKISTAWNGNGNCCLVVGATYPEEMAIVRKIAPKLPFLIPGVGKQGGTATDAVKNGKDANGQGMIINSSRGIIFASKGIDFPTVAREQLEALNDEIRQALEVA